MKSDSSILRELHKIQQSVPDKDFFANLLSEVKADEKRRKKRKGGLFSHSPFGGSKKSGKVDIEIAREKIKSFNNSFKYKRRKQSPSDEIEPGLMSIQEMNDFRNSIKETAENEDAGHSFRALEGIVKFVDLKNSGVYSGKQDILFDCLKKVALVLMEDGGLSMFHATWFYTIYKEYLGHYRMFRKGEFEKASATGSKEAKDIAKKLFQKQYELPHYLQLVDEDRRDIKQLLRYSKEPYIKRSIHGQKGCSFDHIRKAFHDKIKAEKEKTTDQSLVNEISIIMSYAMFFTRIPMMFPLVELLVHTIPNINTETTLYKEKILIALHMVQLDLMRGVSKNDGSDQHGKRLFEQASAIFSRCTNLIRDNRLHKDNLRSDIHVFPFLKQAMILITYRQLFNRNRNLYLKMIENSMEHLKTLAEAAKGPQKHLAKASEYVDIYERNLNAIVEQIKIDNAAESSSGSPKPS